MINIQDKYYENIKEYLLNNEVSKKAKNYVVNRNDLKTYYNVGKELVDAGKHYGEEIIKKYSLMLTKDLGKGYSQRNLRNMRQFYLISIKWQTMSAKLSWSHYCEILWFEESKFVYYEELAYKNNLSVRALRDKVKAKEYERLDENTKLKLIEKSNKPNVVDFVKNPILIKNSLNYEMVSEKLLQKLILEDITNFMNELGEGFSFIDNEYKIRIGDRYNYIDLLLYNYKFKCFVVIELKVTELNSNHTGQIQNYMNYINKNVKGIDDNKTVGIIICKKNNQYVIDYCSDTRIISREYILIKN